jgi:hypothetical protein
MARHVPFSLKGNTPSRLAAPASESPLMQTSTDRLVLRNLPLASRLALAAFLVSVGVGYFAALIQLHFQHASPGKLLPDADDAAAVYHGRGQLSQMERLLTADECKPFNGSGSMRQTFTSRAAGWKAAIKRRAAAKSVTLTQAEQELRREREGERLAVLHWVRTGASRKTFEDNQHVLSAALASHPITAEFVDVSADGTARVKVAAIFETRCARCHAEGAGGQGGQFPLETWEQINDYCQPEASTNGMSLKKLAQSTHVHLLGFAMLYGLTGLIVSFTSYPGWLRCPLAVLPLAAQLTDIGFWWLGRLDPQFARAIVFTGGLVAVGLLLQIVLSLFNLFGRTGKAVLVAALLTAAVGTFVVKTEVIDPYLARERTSEAAPQ